MILKIKENCFSGWTNYEAIQDGPAVDVALEIDNGAFYPAATRRQDHWRD
jgi:hypothetical protein